MDHGNLGQRQHWPTGAFPADRPTPHRSCALPTVAEPFFLLSLIQIISFYLSLLREVGRRAVVICLSILRRGPEWPTTHLGEQLGHGQEWPGAAHLPNHPQHCPGLSWCTGSQQRSSHWTDEKIEAQSLQDLFRIIRQMCREKMAVRNVGTESPLPALHLPPALCHCAQLWAFWVQ